METFFHRALVICVSYMSYLIFVATSQKVNKYFTNVTEFRKALREIWQMILKKMRLIVVLFS